MRHGNQAEDVVDDMKVGQVGEDSSKGSCGTIRRDVRRHPAAIAIALGRLPVPARLLGVIALATVLALGAGVAGPAVAAPAGGVPALDGGAASGTGTGTGDGRATGAEAGPGAGSAGGGRGADAGGRSFASAFFIARKLGGDGGTSRVELIGSGVIWLLLLLSVGSLGLIGQLAAANRRAVIMPAETFAMLRDQLKAGRYREAISEAERDGSFFAEVLASSLREGSHGWEAMIHALDQRTDELVADRQRRIEILNVLGQVSPMIGLFGTVYGMILAFQSIVSAGGAADPVMLAGGIGTALTTTFWGLVVAIPALTGYAVVRSLMDARTAEAALAAEELVGLFRPRPRSRRSEEARRSSRTAAPGTPGGSGGSGGTGGSGAGGGSSAGTHGPPSGGEG